MKYLNERTIRELGIDWPGLLMVIEDATSLLRDKKISQPVKPYLRFNDPANRIIAMPAYVGGKFNAAGIKWIASFPGNIAKSIKRAHSVIILNDTLTGIPTAVINTPLISGIRTACVSGFVLSKYLRDNDVNDLDCGIIGFGPIGRLHMEMLNSCFGDRIRNLFVYDLNPVSDDLLKECKAVKKIKVCTGWSEVYEKSNVFITCTVSGASYVNTAPRKGAVYLNVSLRDFQPEFVMAADVNIVDNWEEVCREHTDVENAHVRYGLKRNDVLEIQQLLEPDCLSGLTEKSFMFHPMGMAIYDIAVAKYYYDLAVSCNNYDELED